jgi:hypothetical protein
VLAQGGGQRHLDDSKLLIPAHEVRGAEIVLLSKVDLLDERGWDSAMAAVQALSSDATVIPYSIRTMQGVDKIAAIVLSQVHSMKARPSEDHIRFATERSTITCYSSTSRMRQTDQVDLYDLATSVLRAAADSFPSGDLAHVKIIVTSPKVGAKMSLVADSVQTDWVRGSRYLSEEAKLVVNSRVMAAPQRLGEVVRSAVESLPSRFELEINDITESCYSPRPETPKFISGIQAPNVFDLQWKQRGSASVIIISAAFFKKERWKSGLD